MRVPRALLGSRLQGEAGFTLVELMIAMAVLGVGLAFAVNSFLNGWQLWKRTFDELVLQSRARRALALVTQALREATPGSVKLSSPAGKFSRIEFTDIRGRGWAFYRSGWKAQAVVTTGATTATTFLAENVAMLSFMYPSFQDTGLIDVGICLSATPYAKANHVVVQLSERVMLRNP